MTLPETCKLSSFPLFLTFRVLRGRLRRQELAALPVQPEVHVDAEGRDLAALQEPPGRGRPAARRGPAGRLHHSGAAPREAGPLPQPGCPFKHLPSIISCLTLERAANRILSVTGRFKMFLPVFRQKQRVFTNGAFSRCAKEQIPATMIFSFPVVSGMPRPLAFRCSLFFCRTLGSRASALFIWFSIFYSFCRSRRR